MLNNNIIIILISILVLLLFELYFSNSRSTFVHYEIIF